MFVKLVAELMIGGAEARITSIPRSSQSFLDSGDVSCPKRI